MEPTTGQGARLMGRRCGSQRETGPARHHRPVTAVRRTANTCRPCGLTVGAWLLLPCPLLTAEPRRDPGRVPPPKWTQETLDAFLPDARRVLAVDGGRRVTPPSKPSPSAGVQRDRPGDGWSRRIMPETLEDEIKASMIRLEKVLSSAPRFKSGGFRDAQRLFHLLAVWFAVIEQHDAETRWTGQAASVSQRMAAAARQCAHATDAAYRVAQKGQWELSDLIRGSRRQTTTPNGLPDWESLSPRTALMQRLEEAWQERLRPWLADASQFRGRRGEVMHEAQIASVLARVIQSDGYAYAEEAEYADLAQQLETAARRLTDAARNGDYDEARQAGARMSRTCSQCHDGFRG